MVFVLVKIDVDLGVGKGLTRGDGGGIWRNYFRVETNGGREDNRADVGVIIDWGRRRDADGLGAAVLGVEIGKTEVGGIWGQIGAIENKVTLRIGDGNVKNTDGREFDSGVGGGKTENSNPIVADRGGDGNVFSIGKG